MKRVHLFEIEDQTWCPLLFRNLITDWLQFAAKTFQLYDGVVPLIQKVLLETSSRQIIDLCSGSSGPWSHLASQTKGISILLTDKYPNIEAFRRISRKSGGQIGFISYSVDATNVPPHLIGMRTIFTGFHHFRPEMAKAILQSSVKCRSAIGIFEFTERRLQNCTSTLISIPILVWKKTPFIRPLKFSRIFWTYCVPIAPLLIMWDGLVSHLRTYSVVELEELISTIDNGGYNWELGQYRHPSSGIPVTYLLGYPVD